MNIKPEQVESILKSLPQTIRGVVIYGSNEGMVSTLSENFIKCISNDIYDAFHVSYLDMTDISADISCLYAEYNGHIENVELLNAEHLDEYINYYNLSEKEKNILFNLLQQ